MDNTITTKAAVCKPNQDKKRYVSIPTKTRAGSFLKENESYQIPEGYYLLLGDNRDGSRDSRDFGPIKKEAIVGRAWLRYWPPEQFGFTPEPVYNSLP